MAPNENVSAVAGISQNNSIPSWITKDYFEKIVSDEFGTSSKIKNFKVESGSAAGDNYAAVLLRILIVVELEDGSEKEFSLMMKSTHPDGSSANQMLQMLQVFSKENEMYETIIPAFEQLYRVKGKQIVFSPKMYKLSKDPGVETVVLEDLRTRHFKNANRVEGLDMDHTKSVLKKLAQFHAASAVYYETKGPFADKLNVALFDQSRREVLIQIFGPLGEAIKQAYSKNLENGEHYAEMMFGDLEKMVDKSIETNRIKPEEFNVLNHGDSWCNNIMFNYTDEGKLDETILIDFQMVKYGSPAQDLLYFIFSSTSQEIRLAKFDYMIRYYHESLVENLKLLNYPKKLPTLAELHISILKNGGWARSTLGILAIALLESTENANLDNLMKSDEEGVNFKNILYSNPKYVKCLNEILPWLENRGMLE